MWLQELTCLKIEKSNYKNDCSWDPPAEHQVLVLGQQPILLDDEGHDGVDVQALQKHKHEADREEVVNQDGLNLAKLQEEKYIKE